ncbi:MAG TPA: inositol monophosphatase family protein [Nitrososphaerales archaeon]|nr:inositol monophosphatase family protein [Nitrososphaerales archaeon]
MNDSEWEKVLLEATERVRRVAGKIASGPRRAETVGVGAAGDMTSLADKAAEDELVAAIRRGGASILSEEAGLLEEKGTDTLAVVDPLDGSSNFERGIPFYCTSVAIVEGNEVAVGVIRDLVTGDAYAARRGAGAKMNGKPIACSGATEPGSSIVALDLSRSGRETSSSLVPLEAGSGRVVHYGANALELCYLASGRIDAFVDFRGKMRVTDVAAAVLIAQEAGAKVTGRDGGKVKLTFDLRSRYSVAAAATPRLLDSILSLARA